MSTKAPNLTDVGNAERLVRMYGDQMRYCHPQRRWYVYVNGQWRPDVEGLATRHAKYTVKSIYAKAAQTVDSAESAALAKHAANSERAPRIRDMLSLAASEPGIPVQPHELDADPWLFNVENGTVDLRTGLLRPHDPADLITKMAPVQYDLNAAAPVWAAFIERVMAGDRELIEFVQRAVGYSLTGLTDEQVFFFLHGPGSNGKTKLLEALSHLWGGYASSADFSTFLMRRNDGPRNDIARLHGARFVTAIEAGEGRKLDEAVVKQLTGGDTISARFLHQEAFEFRPSFKIWLASNHKPHIHGNDNGMWRRVRLIPFTVTIPEAERDLRLAEKLRAELPGILAWAVVGCRDWQRKGLGEAAPVSAATAEYREEMDRLGVFIAEKCEEDAAARVAMPELYKAYVGWATESGEEVLSKSKLGAKLTDRGFGSERKNAGREKVTWRTGLRLASGQAGQALTSHLRNPSQGQNSSRNTESASPVLSVPVRRLENGEAA